MKNDAKLASRRRALNAARAMTFSGALGTLAGCTPSTPPGETPQQTVTRVATQATTNAFRRLTAAECDAKVEDDVCPEHCTLDNDIDCCNNTEDDYCRWNPQYGCRCALEGPFRPPHFTA